MVSIEDFEGEIEEQRNAHIWRYYMGDTPGPVKITLKPGVLVRITTGGRTEEGYSYNQETLLWTGRTLYVEDANQARDCDGRTDHYSLNKTTELGGNWDCDDDEVEYPSEWERVTSSQRDYSAEAMGY